MKETRIDNINNISKNRIPCKETYRVKICDDHSLLFRAREYDIGRVMHTSLLFAIKQNKIQAKEKQ